MTDMVIRDARTITHGDKVNRRMGTKPITLVLTDVDEVMAILRRERDEDSAQPEAVA